MQTVYLPNLPGYDSDSMLIFVQAFNELSFVRNLFTEDMILQVVLFSYLIERY